MSMTASGQEVINEWQQHRHSLDVSTGYPSVIGALYPPGSADSRESMMASRLGQTLKTYLPANITVTYSYRFAKKWDVSAHINLHGFIYGIYQHPEWGDSYNWNATPKAIGVDYSHRGTVLGTSMKYYWHETVLCSWYSSIGAGMYLNYLGTGSNLLFFPHLTPVGFHRRIKMSNWYLLGELSLSFSGTGIIAGIGYRF